MPTTPLSPQSPMPSPVNSQPVSPMHYHDHVINNNGSGNQINNTNTNYAYNSANTVNTLLNNPSFPPVNPPFVQNPTYPLVACPDDFVRITTRTLPPTATMHKASGLPIGLVVRPFAPLPIPLLKLTMDMPRCRGCRVYINPFVIFLDSGRKWKCNICTKLNGVPQQYFCNLNANGFREDLHKRPELTNGAYEFVSSADSSKPSIPPIYVFVIDVTLTSTTNAIPLIITDVISNTIDDLVELNSMTQFCLITFDSRIQYYHFNAESARMLVHADSARPTPPEGYKLLVRLRDYKAAVLKLLADIPEIYKESSETRSCYGSALEGAYEIIHKYGGKIMAFSATAATVGKHALSPTFEASLLGTEKEVNLLKNKVETFKEFGLRCQKVAVTVDQYFYGHYNDIASLDTLSQLTGGQVYHYPQFSLQKDAALFGNNIRDNLLRNTGWNCVLRLKCNEGLKAYQFYGHQFIRGVDLLAMSSLDGDKSFAMELQIVDDLQKYVSASREGGVCIQVVVIYGSSSRERRTRIFTIQCPVSSSLPLIYQSLDVNTIVNVMAKQILRDMLSTSLTRAREKVIDFLVAISQAYAKFIAVFGQLAMPDTLKSLPLYAMALLKHAAMRPGTNPDTRAAIMSNIEIMGVEDLVLYLYPRLMLVSHMTEECGLPDENGDIVLPPLLNLNSSSLVFTDGVMLLDNGAQILLWVSRTGGNQIAQMFGTWEVEKINWSEVTMDFNPDLEPECLYNRVANIVATLRASQTHFMPLLVVNDNTKSADLFLQYLIEDRIKELFSYVEFIQKLNKLITK